MDATLEDEEMGYDYTEDFIGFVFAAGQAFERGDLAGFLAEEHGVYDGSN